MKTTDTRFTDFYSALHAGPATADRVTTDNLLKFLHRLCRVHRVSVLPIRYFMLGAHRAESRPGPALSSQAPTGPHLASPGSRQLPTNMKLFLHCESLVICPPDTLAQLSLVSRKRGRVADVAVITWALSGAGDQAVFYFPLVTRSR